MFDHIFLYNPTWYPSQTSEQNWKRYSTGPTCEQTLDREKFSEAQNWFELEASQGSGKA